MSTDVDINPISPMRLLYDLESRGIRLKVRDSRLIGPKSQLTTDEQELIKEHKLSLIALITYQCPTCNQPLRVKENDSYKYVQCNTDPLHFCELMYKTEDNYFRFFPEGIKPVKCKACGGVNDGEWRYCNNCWMNAVEREAKSA